ncbi:MAG: LysM peptidoglycan-binding domain-containing protein [Lachnospiraceae bacterium]
MWCQNKLTHTIQEGESIYQLAQYYKTNVQSILSLNPQIDPGNLKIGSTIAICPGDIRQNPVPQAACPDITEQIGLTGDMRLVWSQHVYWIRMLMISIAEKLNDQHDVTERLLRNPSDIANVFAVYYPEEAANTIEELLTEHVQILEALITALRDGETALSDELSRQLYLNADEMANAFSRINPAFNREEIQTMLYDHFDLTAHQVEMRLASDYAGDITTFDMVEQEAQAMADYFSQGIIKQFPQSFS